MAFRAKKEKQKMLFFPKDEWIDEVGGWKEQGKGGDGGLFRATC